MEPLTWTGPLGHIVDPVFQFALLVLLILLVAQTLGSYLLAAPGEIIHPDGRITRTRNANTLIAQAARFALYAALGLGGLYLLAGLIVPRSAGIVGAISQRLWPVWVALIATFAVSIALKRRLGLYGKLFDSPVGMIGFAVVMFWVYTAIFAGFFDMIATHDSLAQVSGMKNKSPGTPLRGAEEGDYPFYLLGGDNLARDVFSRVVLGSWVVVQIAPLATLFAFMVGITLGLPAGYFGRSLDMSLSFLANLVLAFPVILLFYLLVPRSVHSCVFECALSHPA